MWVVLVHKNHIALKYTYNIETIFLPCFFLVMVPGVQVKYVEGAEEMGLLNEYVYYYNALWASAE